MDPALYLVEVGLQVPSLLQQELALPQEQSPQALQEQFPQALQEQLPQALQEQFPQALHIL